MTRLVIFCMCVGLSLADYPAALEPYPASGHRPAGPNFDLPNNSEENIVPKTSYEVVDIVKSAEFNPETSYFPEGHHQRHHNQHHQQHHHEQQHHNSIEVEITKQQVVYAGQLDEKIQPIVHKKLTLPKLRKTQEDGLLTFQQLPNLEAEEFLPRDESEPIETKAQIRIKHHPLFPQTPAVEIDDTTLETTTDFLELITESQKEFSETEIEKVEVKFERIELDTEFGLQTEITTQKDFIETETEKYEVKFERIELDSEFELQTETEQESTTTETIEEQEYNDPLFEQLKAAESLEDPNEQVELLKGENDEQNDLLSSEFRIEVFDSREQESQVPTVTENFDEVTEVFEESTLTFEKEKEEIAEVFDESTLKSEAFIEETEQFTEVFDESTLKSEVFVEETEVFDESTLKSEALVEETEVFDESTLKSEALIEETEVLDESTLKSEALIEETEVFDESTLKSEEAEQTTEFAETTKESATESTEPVASTLAGQYYIITPEKTLQKVMYITTQTEEDKDLNKFSSQLIYSPIEPISDPLYAFNGLGQLVRIYKKK